MAPLSIHDSLAYAIHRTARVLRWHFLSLAKGKALDLTPEQWFVLNKLRHKDGASQVELGESIFADRPNMTRMLAGMEERGLVRRAGDPEDGRRMLVVLTPRGRDVHDRFAASVTDERRRIFAGVSERDMVVVRRVLATIEGNLGGPS